MKQPDLIDFAGRLAAMEKSITALEKKVAGQDRQIQELLVRTVSIPTTSAGVEVDTFTRIRIREMARDAIANLMLNPKRPYKKRKSAASAPETDER